MKETVVKADGPVQALESAVSTLDEAQAKAALQFLLAGGFVTVAKMQATIALARMVQR